MVDLPADMTFGSNVSVTRLGAAVSGVASSLAKECVDSILPALAQACHAAGQSFEGLEAAWATKMDGAKPQLFVASLLQEAGMLSLADTFSPSPSSSPVQTGGSRGKGQG